jgi:UDP-glucose 4-epimerase
MIEQILDDLSNQGEINHISLRYFNAAGADSECEIGEEHDPETHLIPLAIFSAMGGKYLSVFGTDFPTPDGTAIRDYIHVEDLASAHLLSLKYLMRDGKSDFFNLGIGKGSSVREIITTLKQLGLNAKSVDAPRREGDPAVLVADATKANRVLKWLPKYKDIKDVLLTAIAWHQKHDKNTSNNC